jgi:thiosulfate/3-mercaptopyruvate sulfurtransferase
MSRTLALAAAVVAVQFALLAPPAAAQQLLVTPAQLARELRDPNLVLLHVGPQDDYDAGHIAGARLVTMPQLAAPRTPGAPVLELPDDPSLRRALEALGIGDRSRVVVIPGADWASPATRIVWTLQVAGLGDRTRMLDGGNAAWRRAGLPLTREVPPPATPGRLTVAQDRSLVVDHAWVQGNGRAAGVRLIDARAPMFFEGPGMTMANGESHAAGHIPGARNIPFNTLANDSLQFLPRAELERIFREAGVRPGDTVVGYCHIGQQATMLLFAARLLGHPTRLYDGSFTDWEGRGLPTENARQGSGRGAAASGQRR